MQSLCENALAVFFFSPPAHESPQESISPSSPTKVSTEEGHESIHSSGRGSLVLFSPVLFLDHSLSLRRQPGGTPSCRESKRGKRETHKQNSRGNLRKMLGQSRDSAGIIPGLSWEKLFYVFSSLLVFLALLQGTKNGAFG